MGSFTKSTFQIIFHHSFPTINNDLNRCLLSFGHAERIDTRKESLETRREAHEKTESLTIALQCVEVSFKIPRI